MIAERDSYRELRARAADLLVGAGGSMEADLLGAELFGASGRLLADSLLDVVLAGDDRFERGPSCWRMIGAAAGAGTAQAFVVALSIATTGADPRRHRIVRIGAVRADPTGVLGRLDLVLSTGRRPARYLVDGARISVDELDRAPTFAEALPELREFLGNDDLYAYGAAWTRAFLEAELARADQLGLGNGLVEIDVLALGLTADGGKPNLAALAGALGVVHPRPGVPIVDAEVAARVVLALRDRPRDASDGPAKLVEGADAPAGPFLTRGWLETVPSSPGVYLMLDDAGAVLYVGKATNLRRRLGAYLGRAPALHRQLEALSTRTARVEVQETPSDLESTLIEARLVARHGPPFNVARRTHPAATYIRLAPSDDPPRVRLVLGPVADGATYVGPLRSGRAARQTVAIARAAFPEAFLRRAVDVARQRQAVIAVGRLLGGQKDDALASLRAEMTAAASRGDSTGVDRARAAIRAVRELTVEPSALIGLGAGASVLVVERLGDVAARAHLLRDGHLAGSADTDLSARTAEPEAIWDLARHCLDAAGAERTGHGPLASDEAVADAIDEPSLIARWLAQSKAVVGVYRVSAHAWDER